MLQEFQQDYEGLLLNLDPDAASAQFVRAWLNLEYAEAIHLETCWSRVLLRGTAASLP